MTNDVFEYSGYHFTPYRKFTKRDGDWFAITRRLESVFSMGMSKYDWGTRPYDYDDFYKACPVGGKDYDIFFCKENGKLLIPCLNELFEYKRNRK